MIFKKNFLLLTLFLIIILQTFLYTNNNQKTSFKYFKWTIQEVSIGKLISISFFSGLLMSTLINTTLSCYKKNTLENIEDQYETYDNEEDLKTNIEMPPQRDIRDSQPTISVNYRIIRNTETKNTTTDKNNSDNLDREDDWDRDNNDW